MVPQPHKVLQLNTVVTTVRVRLHLVSEEEERRETFDFVVYRRVLQTKDCKSPTQFGRTRLSFISADDVNILGSPTLELEPPVGFCCILIC